MAQQQGRRIGGADVELAADVITGGPVDHLAERIPALQDHCTSAATPSRPTCPETTCAEFRHGPVDHPRAMKPVRTGQR